MEDIQLDVNNFDFEQLKEMAILLATTYGLNIFFALVIFFVGKWLARKATNLATKMMSKSKIDKTLVSFADDVIFALLITIVAIAAVNRLGIDTTHIAAMLAAAGLAVGLALQGSLSNLAAGVMIILFRPFRVGDYIEAAGTAGIVEDISIFTTNFTTPDNKHVVVPNNEITAGVITNYSAKKRRRIDLVIGVSYDDDLKKTRKVIEKVLSADKRILSDPAPTIGVSELADSSVNFVVRPWVNTDDYWPVRFDTIENIKIALDKAGITIPYPQRDLYIKEGGYVAKKEAPKKETKKKAA